MMLMIDFLLSREAQLMYRDIGYDSARKDLRSPNEPTQKIYFTQRPHFFEEYEEWTRLFDSVFTRKR